MLDLRFASTELQKSVLTGSRLFRPTLIIWTISLAEESLTQASVQTPS